MCRRYGPKTAPIITKPLWGNGVAFIRKEFAQQVEMDPNLHQKMGIHHLNRVLDYSQFVADDGIAIVHLTQEDWHVVADTLFRMDTPDEMLPDAIQGYRLADGNQVIELTTDGCLIRVDMM